MNPRNRLSRMMRIVPLVVIILLCTSAIPALSQDKNGPGILPKPTQDAPVIVTEVPDGRPHGKPTTEPTIEPTAEPTQVPTTAPAEPTVQNGAPGDPTAEPTETEIIIATPKPDGDVKPEFLQTYCLMEINDSGDTNPFTFGFSVPQSANIASFAWDFGDGGTASGATASHTYAAAAPYTVTLTCTPEPGFGSPFLLTGSITIAPVVSARFELLPGYILTELAPFTITTVNQSTPDIASTSYAWQVRRNGDNFNPGCDSAAKDITCDLPDYGVWRFSLTVIVPGGSPATMFRDVALNAPPPTADFTVSPVAGLAPLSVTVDGFDLGTGPITDVEWDFDYNGVTFDIDATGFGPHTPLYTTEGVYTIRMMYTGPGGSGFKQKQVLVEPSDGSVQADFSWELTGNNPGGQIEVCFTNESTGPFTQSEWDFDGNGTYEEINDESPICKLYDSEGNVTVLLKVSNGPTVFSEDAQNVSLHFAPVADFTITPGAAITLGTLVSFDGNVSTGDIDTYDWAVYFDDLEISTSTGITYNNLNLTQVGPYRIRLTVTGPGGSSYAEKAVMVSYAEATCVIQGNLSVTPGGGTEPYSVNLGQLQGRTPDTYAWRITGSSGALPQAFSTPSISIDWNSIGQGVFLISVDVTLDDGSVCSASATVNVYFPPLDCVITPNAGSIPNPLYPVLYSTTFNGALSTGTSGRPVSSETITLFRDGVPVASSTNSVGFTNDIVAANAPISWLVRYEVVLVDGTSCFDEVAFQTVPYPTPNCVISGPTAPRPNVGTQSGLHNYTLTINNGAGRPIDGTGIVWSVGPNGTLQFAQGSNPMRVLWQAIAAPPYNYASSVSATVSIVNADGTTVPMNCNLDVTPTVQRLNCAAPTGDLNPVVNETVIYNSSLGNVFGRTPVVYNWTLTRTDVGPTVVATGTSATISYLFDVPGATYTLFYTATVGDNVSPGGTPTDSCTSPTITITVYVDVTQTFNCDAFPNGQGNNFSPNNPADNYVYTVDIDNGNGLTLRYTWTLIGPNGQVTPLGFIDSAANQFIPGPTWTFVQLTPFGVGVYTLRVDVTAIGDPLPTTFTCGMERTLTVGSITVQYDYAIDDGWTLTALPVDTDICITNTSSSSTGGTETLLYDWLVSGTAGQNSLGATAFTTTDLPDCISFNTPGSYTITVNGVNNYGQPPQDAAFEMTGSYNRTFNVYGVQSISIQRNDTSVFANANVSFSATNVQNLTPPHTFELRSQSDDSLVASNTTGSFSNVVAGAYYVVVWDTGPLGRTEASMDFVLLPANDLRASFRATPYAGIAPLEVCFTDTSRSNTSILEWWWDFEFDGVTFTPDLNYTTPPGSPICHTYTDAGTSYTVQLRVRNSTFTREASNRIRTYSLLEMGANFSIAYQGNGQYCYTPTDLTPGTDVTGWDFGDGTVISVNDDGTVCHSYNVSVDLDCEYVIVMYVEGPGGEIGEVIRVIPCILPVGTPDLTMTAVCDSDRTATFTVTNNGEAMQFADQITIRDRNGVPVLIAPVQLGAGASANFTVSNMTGTVTGALSDANTVTASTTCFDFDVTGVCGPNSLPVFTVTNNYPNDGEMPGAQAYEIRDSANALILSGTFFLPQGTGSIQIPVPVGSNPYDSYTFISSGAVGDFTVSHGPCTTQPALGWSGVCIANASDAQVGFTITNTGGDMVVPQAYEVRQGVTVVAAGDLSLASGASVTITVPGGEDPYATYTFVTTGFAGDLNVDHSCARVRPSLEVNGACTVPRSFTVTNTGGDMLEPQAWQVTQGVTPVSSGSVFLAAGASETFFLPDGSDPYGTYTFASSGFADTVSVDHTCDAPDLAITGLCSVPREFTVTNTGNDMLTGQAYEITRGGATVASGTLDIVAGGSETITLTASDTPYGTYTFVTSGFAGDLTIDHECGQPSLEVTGGCAVPREFTVTNTGDDMLTGQAYEITRDGTTVDSDTLDLTGGGSTVISLDPALDPYGTYTFETDGFAGTVTMGDPCSYPALSAEYVCAAQPSVIIVNGADDMLVPQTVTVTSAGVVVFTQDIQLAAGQQITLALTTVSEADDVTVSISGGFAGTVEIDGSCSLAALAVEGVCAIPPGFIVTNTGQAMTRPHGWRILSSLNQTVLASGSFELGAGEVVTINLPDGVDATDGVTFISDDFGVSASLTMTCSLEGELVSSITGFGGVPSQLPAVQNCGRGCPVFKLYHTDEHGGWEIYRLDGANQTTRTNTRANLSFGLSADVTDLAPSLSPDNNWIIFQSNRDGNWELYVAPTSGGNANTVQRVTFNEIAIDGDPVWGPNNYVVFETTRHGDWDLYLIDMSTGDEYRLTDSGGNDINPYWSEDGSRLVFQSDRPDENGVRQWQVYEIDLSNRQLTKLSDGSAIDVEPAYGNATGKIAFRTYKAEGEKSVLAFMDADGSNRTVFSGANGDATNAVWSPSDRFIAYQSDLDGDLDIYVYEVATGETRHLTGNDVADYAPTWLCDDVRLLWTSDIEGNPNLFEVIVTPIDGEPIDVALDADQMTFDATSDIYPMGAPSEENASREGTTVLGDFGLQTSFINPPANLTRIDLSNEGLIRDPLPNINMCPARAGR